MDGVNKARYLHIYF